MFKYKKTCLKLENRSYALETFSNFGKQLLKSSLTLKNHFRKLLNTFEETKKPF